jgi:drug/metabolite transporter (DMT)-like permease
LPDGARAFAKGALLSVPDALSVLGGFTFALTSVMLKRLQDAPSVSRMLGMFGGGALLASLSASAGMAMGTVAGLPPVTAEWVVLALGLAAAFLVGNYAMQYGAVRLAAGTTAIVMLTEIVFASASSVALGAAVLEAHTLIGGGMIMLAALLAALQTR